MTQPLVIRVGRDELREHHLRMRRIGIITLVVSIIVGIAAPIISIYIGILSCVALVGLIFAIDMLVRSGRGLKEDQALQVTIDRRSVTAQYEGKEPHVVMQPIMGGQAFQDHLQLVAGTSPKPIFQIEIPMEGDQRAAYLERLRSEHRVHAPERRAFAVNLAYGLIIVPAIIIPLFLLVSLIGIVIEVGVVAGLMALGPKLGVAVMLVLALGGALVFLKRIVRRK